MIGRIQITAKSQMSHFEQKFRPKCKNTQNIAKDKILGYIEEMYAYFIALSVTD